MWLRGSTDTIVANLAQQASGLFLFLVIPNILPVAQYAVVVIASVILGFTRFPDLGLSLVYGRDAPRYYGSGDQTMIQPWNEAIIWFGVLSGVVVGVIAGVVFYANGGYPEHAVLLALVPPLTAMSSAYMSLASVRGEFRRYRDAQVFISLGRVLAIPLALLFGLIGWFIAQVVGVLAVFIKSGVGWIPQPPRIQWALVKTHLPSGIQLSVISLLWFQLLDSARLFATIHYHSESIAVYGIVAAGYQSAYSLIIAAFLPVSVKTLRLMGSSDREAVEYVHHVIGRSLPLVFLLAVVGAEVAPWFLRLVFPQYSIDSVIPRVMLYGLSAMPIVATVGNLLVGRKKNMTYFLILASALAVAAVAEAVMRQHIGVQSAVFAQVFGMFALVGMLLVAGRMQFASTPAVKIFRWWTPALWLVGLWGGYFALRLIVVGSVV